MQVTWTRSPRGLALTPTFPALASVVTEHVFNPNRQGMCGPNKGACSLCVLPRAGLTLHRRRRRPYPGLGMTASLVVFTFLTTTHDDDLQVLTASTKARGCRCVCVFVPLLHWRCDHPSSCLCAGRRHDDLHPLGCHNSAGSLFVRQLSALLSYWTANPLS